MPTCKITELIISALDLAPDRAARVRALAGDIELCSWGWQFTLTVPLSTQVYKWVPANLILGITRRWTSIPSRGQKKYSWSLHATEIGISSSLMGHLVRMQTLPCLWNKRRTICQNISFKIEIAIVFLKLITELTFPKAVKKRVLLAQQKVKHNVKNIRLRVIKLYLRARTRRSNALIFCDVFNCSLQKWKTSVSWNSLVVLLRNNARWKVSKNTLNLGGNKVILTFLSIICVSGK